VVVCALGGIIQARGSGAPNALTSKLTSAKLMFGRVGDTDVADSILNDARAKYEASKQRLASKHSSAVSSHSNGAVKSASVAKPADAAKSSEAKAAAKHETALTLEEKIAQHKITTRDLVKEVEEKQKQQAKAMAGQLQDQTDDLIVASIKAMKKKETVSGDKGTVGYVLDNALTKQEKQSLAHGAAMPEAEPAQANIDAVSKKPKAVSRMAKAAALNANKGVEPKLMETPPGMSLNNKKPPDTTGMLSAYDQSILKMGLSGADSSTAASPSPPSSPPTPQYQAAPQYSQPQYQAPPYQQLAVARPAAPYGYQQQAYQPAQVPVYSGYTQQLAAPPQGSYAAPQYAAPQYPYNAYQPAAPVYAPYPAQYQQPQQYEEQQLYAAPAPYPYSQGAYAQQPYQRPYPYAQPQYPQYQQPGYQQLYAPRPMVPEAAAPPPTPAQRLEKAKQLEASEKNGGAAVQQAAVSHPQSLAAYTTAGPGGPAEGGGLLWRMFTAPETSYQQPRMVAPAPAPQQQQLMEAPASAPLSSSVGATSEDSMAAIDPQNLGVGTRKDAVASLSMSASAKESIKAKMMALRQGILNDFRKTTDMGAQAGYLPPPPMP
jgi:hypothetical protein